MIIDRKTNLTPSTSTSKQVRQANGLRSGLGLLGDWRVTRIERQEKAAAASELVKATVATALDIAKAQLEIDATIMKSTQMARAVPVLGGLLDELVVRAGHVRLGLGASEHAGIVAAIKHRHQRHEDYQQLCASGQMTEAELSEMNAHIAQRASEGCTRFLRDVDRAHEGLDAHLGRVVDHVKNISREGN